MERTIGKQVGYSHVDYIIDNHNGEYLDTKVVINDQLLCVIAGNTINEFQKELELLINKYRI
jgi:hypothetical protein